MRVTAVFLLCLLTAPAWADDASHETGQPLVDLSDSQATERIVTGQDRHVLANPWWENLDVYGFGAAGFYDTGSSGTRAHGGFEIKEASIFIEAAVWAETALFFELQMNRLGKDDQLFTRTGEVYLHFRDMTIGNDIEFGLKLGRIDIPFGEEYLWQDAIDNPLITNSAAYPYGWDEGVLVYADRGPWSLIAALTDGTDARSSEENSDKAFNLKISRRVSDSIQLSFSAMRNGDGTKSAVEFGGSHFQPVGASHPSSLVASPSIEVGAHLFQFDAKFDFDIASKYAASLALVGGYADQSDDAPGFDRQFRWFSVEPFVRLNPRVYWVARYSEIGTYDSEEGYHFDGKTFAGGNSAFGYDTEKFRRLGVGVGWQPNPRVTAKMEVGKDWFDLIDASTLTDAGNREFVGLEVAVKF